MKYHWIVIETLLDCIENGVNEKKLRNATLQLDMELDRYLVGNLPTEELERLKSTLERLNYDIVHNE